MLSILIILTIYFLERPENHKQIQRTAEIKQQRDVQENGNQESKKVDRNIHISECYSITPIVNKIFTLQICRRGKLCANRKIYYFI